MNQIRKADFFTDLHVKGNPVILYNAWDVGSAKAILQAGLKVIATSSWAIAETQGYGDGELIPLEIVKDIVGRIVSTIDAPVSMDFEGGYSDKDEQLEKNISEIIDLGISGINFEDRIVKGEGLYDITRQARRIEVIRRVAQKKNIPLFINARTDVFFGPKGNPEKFLQETISRGKSYADAGASGLFIPGLTDAKLISQVVESVPLPINVLVMDGLPTTEHLAKLGVARISYGSKPYIKAMRTITEDVTRLITD